jgi:uncharacterized membrane protein
LPASADCLTNNLRGPFFYDNPITIKSGRRLSGLIRSETCKHLRNETINNFIGVLSMAMRLHEVHPTLAHYPLALFPVALVADLLGKLTGRRELMKIGAALLPVAAVSGVVTAASGLVAQEAVEPGEAHDMLVTHRNMNIALVGLMGALTLMRLGQKTPTAGYLLAGAGAMAGMTYTAYLGGKMVYDHGVGVMPAHGVRTETSPEIRRYHVKESMQAAADNARHGAEHVVEHLRQGQIAPLFQRH